ncbi:cytochrome P450 20A1-like [Lineus longissimus]|uniref:cytochrome P450 20A1-like n=1 Tax=Lineus longissimus TaxID=88925 RepID=UPI002B4CC9FE
MAVELLNPVTASLLAILCAVFLWTFKKWERKQGSSEKPVPGLKASDPIHGNKHDIDAAGSLHEFLTNLHKRYGPIASFWMGKELTISIASPELFKQHAIVFDRPPQLFIKYQHMFGPQSVQYSNKEKGRRQRQPFDDAYGHQAMAVYYPTFNDVVGELVEHWSSLSDGETIALKEEMTEMSIKAITQATFGDYFKDESEVKKLHHCYNMIMLTAEHNVDGSLPEPGTPERAEFDEADSEKDNIIRKMIHHRRATRSLADRKLFIDELLDSDVPEIQLYSDALINVVGGFHNVASMLIFALYHLGVHQDMQEKAYREICDVLGDDDVDPYAYSQLTYLRQIIDETLRRNLVVPWAARFDQDKDTTLGGYVIKEKTPVIHALGVVLMDENIWPEPERFDPDRFAPGNTRSRPLLSNVPFGFAGGRKCPGFRYTLADGVTTLAIILRKFKVTTVPNQTVKRAYGLITLPEDEIYVTVEPRAN